MPAERGPSGTGHDTACECDAPRCERDGCQDKPTPPPVAECGRLPFGVAIGPSPTTLYLCAYCNEGARLRDEGVVVDRFSNVCHESCLAAVSGGR